VRLDLPFGTVGNAAIGGICSTGPRFMGAGSWIRGSWRSVACSSSDMLDIGEASSGG
jgi:hypothetical protein